MITVGFAINGRKYLFNGLEVLLYFIGISNEDALTGDVYLHLDCYEYEGIYIGDSR